MKSSAAQRIGAVLNLAAYYEAKTRTILQRYGPGPRVHYHTGLVDQPEPVDAPHEELRLRLIASQEHMLWYAAKVWDACATVRGEVLDVGCGLGGGAIFWAQEFGARVTAVTTAPSHIKLIEQFAEQAGVKSQVRPLLCDALMVPGKNRFDAAVAIDSSSSFPREPWFRRLAVILRPGGHVFVFDCFLYRCEYQEPFNRHWRAQIGTLDEYISAALKTHFVVKSIEDVSARAVNFWTINLAMIRAEAQEGRLSEAAELGESMRIHALVRQGLIEGGLRQLLLTFAKA